MTNERVTETLTPHITIIDRRGGGLLIGLAILLAAVVAAFSLLNQSKNDNLQTTAVTFAAKNVDGTADKVDAAIDGCPNNRLSSGAQRMQASRP